MKTRIDKFIASEYALSRATAAKLIKSGQVSVDGIVLLTPSQIVSDLQNIAVILPPQEEKVVTAENIPLEILYEDDDTLVINKQSGISVTVSDYEITNTLTNALLFHYPNLASVFRQGIVHRLDKETSGVLLIAKSEEAQAWYMAQFKSREIKKEYRAFCDGQMVDMVIEKPIARNPHNRKKMAVVSGGKYAYTKVVVLEKYKAYTKLALRPLTGRTHQLRVHLKSVGHPIVGDNVYHGSAYPHMLLHAYSLSFQTFQKQPIEVISQVPGYFDDFEKQL